MLAVVLLLAMVSPPRTIQAKPGASLVEVANTPLPVSGSVHVANAPTVQVGNSLLPVQEVNDTLSEPYNVSNSLEVLANQPGGDLAFDIPAGRRLVTETVMVRLRLVPQAHLSWTVDLHTLVNGTEVVSPLALLVQQAHAFSSGDTAGTAATLPVRMRLDGTAATDEIRIRAQRAPGLPSFFLEASIHGYLVDLPGAG
jgi:hypothetical protein